MSDLMSLIVMLMLLAGGVGIIIWLAMVFYLKTKWLPYVEEILDGHRFFSLTIFLSAPGTLHYATVFFSKFHAKRYKMLEKRDLIPQKVQRLFIICFYLCFISGILFFSATGIIYLLEPPQ